MFYLLKGFPWRRANSVKFIILESVTCHTMKYFGCHIFEGYFHHEANDKVTSADVKLYKDNNP